MKKTKRNFIYENFKSSLIYIKDSRYYIYFAIALFFISALIGYLFPHLFEAQVTKMIKDLLMQTEGLKGFDMISFIITNNVKSSFFGLFLGLFFGVISIGMTVLNGFLLGFVANRAVHTQGLLVLWKLFPHGIFEIPAVLISIGLGIKLGFFYKDKDKGIVSFVLSFFLFVVISGFLAFFALMSSESEKSLQLLISNHLFIYFLIMFGIWIASVILSSLVYSKKERKEYRKEFFSNLKKSVFVFLLVIIPLLVIAGFIEGILINLLG